MNSAELMKLYVKSLVCLWNYPYFWFIKVYDVQMGIFLMSGKVLKTIYFLKGNNSFNSNLILLGLDKQRGITLEA